MAFDANKYVGNYIKEHYHVVRVLIPKECKPVLQETAKHYGKSMSQLFVDSAEKCYGINLSK